MTQRMQWESWKSEGGDSGSTPKDLSTTFLTSPPYTDLIPDRSIFRQELTPKMHTEKQIF